MYNNFGLAGKEVLKGTGWKIRLDWVFENDPFYGVVLEKRLF
jgi:hypothetical protein